MTENVFTYSEVDERDLKIEYTTSRGPGGQSVNKTESAVRIVHIPTGITVTNQDERNKHQNKAKALDVLHKRIYEIQLNEYRSGENSERKKQIGSGNLCEKIRTYNWPDSRVTDHRLGVTLHNIDKMLDSTHLETILNMFIEQEKTERINKILEKLN